MKRTIIRIIVIALLALAVFIPQSVAFARVEDSDNGCPPRASQGIDHASSVGLWQTYPIDPPAPSQAWNFANPGNK